MSYIFRNFAADFKLINMEKVIVRFGRSIKVEFDATEMKQEAEGRKAFARVNTLKAVDAPSGLVAIDFKMQRAMVVYDGIEITSSIFFCNEAEGNYHLRCATDQFMFDVYVLLEGADESLFDRPINV